MQWFTLFEGKKGSHLFFLAELLREELDSRSESGRLPKAVISTDIYGQCAVDRYVKIYLTGDSVYLPVQP